MEQPQVAEITISYKPAISRKPIITRSLDAYNEMKNFFPEELIQLQEMFAVMYLNRANRIIGIYRLSTGGLSGTVVDIRLVLATGLKVAATAIIMAHNHPSGNLRPSHQDEQITRKVKEACAIMDIRLSDHIILSAIDGEYFSFADEGLI